MKKNKDLFALTQDEKKDLEYFFNELLFQNYGAYVLFGSKPISEMTLLDDEKADIHFQKYWRTLSEDEKSKIREDAARGKVFKLKRDPYACWKTFQRTIEKLPIKQYIFAIKPYDSDYQYQLFFVNIPKTAFIIAENYDLFRKYVGKDFHPLELVFDIENPNSHFWNTVFSSENHVIKGLLFGFGKENALLYDWKNSHEDKQGKVADYLKNIPIRSSSEDIPYFEVNSDRFTIPIFGSLQEDQVVKQYQKEKEKIHKIYKNQDVVDVTLRKLSE